MQTHTNFHDSPRGSVANTNQDTTENRVSFLTTIALGLIVLVALSIVFLSWKKYVLQKEETELSQKIEVKIKTLQGLSQGTNSVAYNQAATALSKAEKYRVRWSEIVEKILKLESPTIQFLQFASSPQKEISIDGIASSMEDIELLLEKLKQDPSIHLPFVSSLAEAESVEGTVLAKMGKVFRFQLTFTLSNSPQ